MFKPSVQGSPRVSQAGSRLGRGRGAEGSLGLSVSLLASLYGRASAMHPSGGLIPPVARVLAPPVNKSQPGGRGGRSLHPRLGWDEGRCEHPRLGWGKVRCESLGARLSASCPGSSC